MSTTDCSDAVPVLASRRAIVGATLAAFAAAVIILLIAVLPAEYGVDPSGLGKLAGFTKLYQEKTEQSVARHRSEPEIFRNNTVEILLGPKQGLEYKFIVKQGGALLYSWTADDVVDYEFHGERVNDASGAFESYEKKTGQSANGSFTAPFEGTHGWYWKNTTIYPITVKLRTAGYYEVKGIIGPGHAPRLPTTGTDAR
jgi:hypothetical protein